MWSVPYAAALPREPVAFANARKIGVEFVLPHFGQCVRAARVLFERRVLNDLCRLSSGDIDRDDLIILTVDDQGRDVE